MSPYLLAFTGLGILGLFSLSRNSQRLDAVTTAVGAAILWILLAFRAPHLGIDVPSYLAGLSMARGAEIWGGGQIFNFEPGFRAYLALVSRTGLSEQGFLALTAALTLVPVAITVSRFSKMPMFSLYLYATVGFYAFAFSGLRQALSVAICFFALRAIKDRRLWRFLLIVGFASMFHQSALVFLPAYWIYRIKARPLDLVYGVVGLALVWIFRSPIYAFLFGLYRDTEATEDQTGAVTLFLALLLVWVAALVLHPPQDDPSDEDRLVTGTRNFLYVAVLFQSLASVSFLVGRVGQYYLIFIILLLPQLLKRQHNPGVRYLLFTGTVMVALGFFRLQAGVYGLLPYTFASDL